MLKKVINLLGIWFLFNSFEDTQDAQQNIEVEDLTLKDSIPESDNKLLSSVKPLPKGDKKNLEELANYIVLNHLFYCFWKDTGGEIRYAIKPNNIAYYYKRRYDNYVLNGGYYRKKILGYNPLVLDIKILKTFLRYYKLAWGSTSLAEIKALINSKEMSKYLRLLKEKEGFNIDLEKECEIIEEESHKFTEKWFDHVNFVREIENNIQFPFFNLVNIIRKTDNRASYYDTTEEFYVLNKYAFKEFFNKNFKKIKDNRLSLYKRMVAYNALDCVLKNICGFNAVDAEILNIKIILEPYIAKLEKFNNEFYIKSKEFYEYEKWSSMNTWCYE
jgi:hypothetical protein